MKLKIYISALIIIALAGLFISFQQQPEIESQNTETAAKPDPLPSWNDGPTKNAIIDFVTKTTKKGSADFIPVSERTACFDNDGTLWSEQPMYFQVAFMVDRVKVLAPQHPEWKQNQPFKAVLEGDLNTALAGGNQAFTELLYATHSGVTTDEFEKVVKD